MAVSLKVTDWEEFDRTRVRLAVEDLMSSENGRFFLTNLLMAFGHASTPFHTDPYLSAFAAGRHSCAKDLEATITACAPLAVPELLAEWAAELQLRKDKE